MSQGSHYTDERRRDAAVLMAVHGNAEHVSGLTGIPRRTLCDWTKQDWFRSILAQVRQEKALELDAQFSRVLASATTQLQDRIEKGDVVLVGEKQVRRPMSGKDLAVVAGIVHDKRERARAPSAVVEDNTDQGEYLFQLAEFLRSRNKAGVGENLPN